MKIAIKNKWGWLITFFTFIAEIPMFGLLTSYGAIFVSLKEEFMTSDLVLSFIGSLCLTAVFTLAPLSTLLFKQFGHQKTAFVGVALASIGLLASSFVPNPYYLFFTYSFLYGAGTNFIENSAINLIAEYFPKKNSARATAFVFLGKSAGFLSMNPFMIYICNKIGWRKSFQILAIVIAVITSILSATFRPSAFEKRVKSLEDLRNQHEKKKIAGINPQNESTTVEDFNPGSLRSGNQHSSKESIATNYARTMIQTIMAPGMLLWNIGVFLLGFPNSFAFVNLLRYLETIGITDSKATEIYAALGIVDFLSRTLFFLFGDYIPFNKLYVYPVVTFCGGVIFFSLLADTTLAGLFVFAIVSGFCIGSIVSLSYKIPKDLFGNLVMAEAWSLTIVFVGLGQLIGPLSAGAIFDKTHSFHLFFVLGGVCCFLATILFLFIPLWQKHKGWKPKNLGDLKLEVIEFEEVPAVPSP